MRKYLPFIISVISMILAFVSVFALAVPAIGDEAEAGAEAGTEADAVENEADAAAESEVNTESEAESGSDPYSIEDPNHIHYFESINGSTFALVVSGQATMLICFDPDVSGLVPFMEKEGVDHLDSVILAARCEEGSGQTYDFNELCEHCSIGHIYSDGSNYSLPSSAQNNVNTEFMEYLSVGDENVILYPDAEGNLGVLVFNTDFSLFAADTLSDMSVLQGHPELAYINVLSISEETGTDEAILTLMNPKSCIITGNLPGNKALSAFYETPIATSRTFYINHSTVDGILINMSSIPAIQDAASLYLDIPDPEIFVVKETEADSESGNGSDVTGKSTVAEAALKVWRGEMGSGQDRTDRLRSAGFTDDEINEVQRLVDKIANEHLGNCIAVLFDAGDYADDPEAQIITVDTKANEPDITSSNEQYQFTGWYKDKDHTEKFDFSTTLNETTWLYAGWEEISEPETDPASEEDQTEAAAEDNQAEATSEEDQTEPASEDNQTEATSEEAQTEPASENNQAEPTSEKDQAEPASENNQTKQTSEKDQAEPASENNQAKQSSEKDQTKQTSDNGQSVQTSKKGQAKETSEDNQNKQASDEEQSDQSSKQSTTTTNEEIRKQSREPSTEEETEQPTR